jgi:hypothetical protein
MKKRIFAMKTGWKSIFHPRGVHIIARLHITVVYNVFNVLKNIEFWLKPQWG